MEIKDKPKKSNFKKIVQFTPAYDKRSDIPGKNYGIGAIMIKFVLIGKKGAVQVLLGTDWYLPSTIKEYREKGNSNLPAPIILRKDEDFLTCWDVGYHSIKIPEYMTRKDKRECDLLPKGYCYYDGSGCRGRDDDVVGILLNKGSDGIWEYLEKIYKTNFE